MNHPPTATPAFPPILKPAELLEDHGISPPAIAILLVLGTLGYFQILNNGLASLAVLAIVMTEFVRRMDRGIPLMQITAVIATLQWLAGPSITYYLGYVHGRYFMYVPDFYYFSYALPATCLYCVCVLYFGGTLDQKRLLRDTDQRQFFYVGLALVAVSFVSQALAPRMPGGLEFLFHLCSQLRYVGALYFLFSHHPARYVCAVLAVAPLFLASAGSGMFHDLILWLAMLSTYWFARREWSLPQKLTFLVAGFFFVFTIQVIKQDYRQKLEAGKAPSLVGEVVGAVFEERFFEQDVLSLATARLNQGWIISAVMLNVPQKEPFAEGETIKTALVATLVPRLLWANKKGAGGQENFKRFTGLNLQKGTSMGISPLGEGFANFGIEVGIVFMGAFGICFSLLYRFVTRQITRHPDLVFWIPLIFYQGIKAETEMIVVSNQLFKGSIVVMVGYTVMRKIMPHLAKRTTRPSPGFAPHVHSTGRYT